MVALGGGIASWLVCLSSFVIFAIVNSQLVLVGQASCGCFGSLQVSPVYALGIDLIVILLLLVSRPNSQSKQSNQNQQLCRASFISLSFLGIVAISFGALAWAASFHFGSIERAIAFIRNERISVEPRLILLGKIDAGSDAESSVSLTNWTDEKIEIIGGTSDCSCIATKNLPIEIAPGQTERLVISVRAPKTPGVFTRTAWFWAISGARQEILRFQLSGQSIARQASK